MPPPDLPVVWPGMPENDAERAAWRFLLDHIRRQRLDFVSHPDPSQCERVARNWFNDGGDYDGRWPVIDRLAPAARRVLDMAAGCGTFLLHGLRRGRDAWGVEPEGWKRRYFAMKVAASGYDPRFGGRLLPGVGEALPFADSSFDLVTSYQTLEHVADVERCLHELLRVVRPGGVLYLRAPDYGGFFEPHYGVPMLPRMNRRLAAVYLRLLGRPLAGLQRLQWTTEKEVVRVLLHGGAGRVRRVPDMLGEGRRSWRRRFGHARRRLIRLLAEEKQIDLWVSKRP